MCQVLSATTPVELERDIEDEDLGDISDQDDTRFKWKPKPKKGKRR